MLSVIDGTSTQKVCPIWRGGATHTHKNNYYLSGIQGIFTIGTITGDTVFYETSDNTEDMTTAKVVTALNTYISSNSDGVNTKDWCKWVIGANNLPELDFSQVWNPTIGESGAFATATE